MTKIQQEIIERIKKSGGVVVATPYGLYTQFGRFVAFPSSKPTPQNTLNAFLKKFFTPFTNEERAMIKAQHCRNLNRYRRLAIDCLKEWKLNSAVKFSQAAVDLSASMDEKNYYKNYYHLKEEILRA